MNKDLALELAQRVQRIKPSATLAVSNRAQEMQDAGQDIISLSIGEPDFDTPNHIKEAAIQAIHDGHTKYTAVDGIKPLKIAIVDKFERENNLRYGLDQILVSCGAKHSIFNALSAILNPGDEVIILAPYWVSYPDMVKLCDGTPVIVKADIEHDFKVSAAQLKAAITSKTRAIIINSPSNPSGMSYDESELRALGEVILESPGIVVISDDIYEHHLWRNRPFMNIVNACPDLYDRTIVVNSVSKTYAMTGWRIGYVGGPAKIVGAMKKAQSQNTSSPPSISQYAALAALSGDQACVGEMTKAYKERHDFIFTELQTMPGIKCQPSDGTFYSFPSIEGLLNIKPEITNDIEFSEYLLNEAGIAVIPGSAFGSAGYIRICYTTSMEQLVDATRRMREAVNNIK
jgi:aspartate aminotransferase